LRPHITPYPLEEANRALAELRLGGIRGSKVLRVR
jgi:D-arabinose 1-dehydrogenase-like Zn-dependent alcohol dehydrogenase